MWPLTWLFGRFYIRSVIRPTWFWYCEGDSIITVDYRQTPFIIRRVRSLSHNLRQSEDILVGRDHVNIFLLPDANTKEVGEMIVRDAGGNLVTASSVTKEYLAQEGAGEFQFGLFERGFTSNDYKNSVVYVNSWANGGQRWEFVN
ncbi:hypothetical protein P691DRAFT_341792 [Macrolepiota fuliginosa MF-IS2]|uniref:Uncharacterized protein n=1 Tax=Macrolepiota fuliginosa MF-IS2 TaxID=1400762 RepID=A0A9P5X4R9_9AGAR|nr:hypothetical protein P691DRAFT_341792 [Macrolepiota fuliginosa MF-IS2]